MALKKDLSIDFLGVHCENPFFLSSSPVDSDYEMVAKAFESGWGGVAYKTVGIFLPDECSPRFDITGHPGGAWAGFKNMEMISDKPLEVNLKNMARLKREYPHKVMIASIMGSNDDEWRTLAQKVTDIGADIIECNFSCPQMTSSTMGSDVGQSPELVAQYTEAVCRATRLPVLAKMTPNIGHMEIPAIAAIHAGAKGIAAINTVKAITNLDLECLSPMPVVNGKSSISGYSGSCHQADCPALHRPDETASPTERHTRLRDWRHRHMAGCTRIFARWFKHDSGHNRRDGIRLPDRRGHGERPLTLHGRKRH